MPRSLTRNCSIALNSGRCWDSGPPWILMTTAAFLPFASFGLLTKAGISRPSNVLNFTSSGDEKSERGRPPVSDIVHMVELISDWPPKVPPVGLDSALLNETFAGKVITSAGPFDAAKVHANMFLDLLKSSPLII